MGSNVNDGDGNDDIKRLEDPAGVAEVTAEEMDDREGVETVGVHPVSPRCVIKDSNAVDCWIGPTVPICGTKKPEPLEIEIELPESELQAPSTDVVEVTE